MLGCDVAHCTAIAAGTALENWEVDTGYDSLVAREFVRIGELEALTCEALDAGVEPDAGGDAGVHSIAAIESRAPSGALEVQIQYHLGQGCSSSARVDVIPVE